MTNKSCEHECKPDHNGECLICDEAEHEEKHDEKWLEEKLKHCNGLDCECCAYGQHECACSADWTSAEVYKLKHRLYQERLAWEKKVDELVKTQLHHLNLLSDYQKKVAELEAILFGHTDDVISGAFQKIKKLQSKLDVAVNALEWYAKNNTKTHWQRKRAEEAIRKIKEM